MALPFTVDAFLDVFARYNTLLWPAVAGLWGASAVVLVIALVAPRPKRSRPVSLGLALLWLWSGAVYHAALFTQINPAAWLFAAAFMAQACLLIWYGIAREDLPFGTARAGRWALGVALCLYALAYPAVTMWTGHAYPRMPTFGVPCPTTILTVGLLVTCTTKPGIVTVVPLLWSVVGGAAALLLGMTADLVLLGCAVVLAVDVWTS